MTDVLEKCVVCKALIDEEDLFCANCGAEAPDRSPSAGEPDNVVSKHNFQCAGCGASMSYDASVKTLRCPFCGSEKLDQQRTATLLAPRRVFPFRVDHDQAVSTIRRWLGKGFWRPGDLASQASIAKTAAVYVPYWVFEATTHTYWTADSSATPPGARADWYPVFGEHRGVYRGLLIGASGALTPSETATLCPFDLSGGVSLQEISLDGVVVEQFRVQRKYARPLAREGLERSEQAACRAEVPGKARNVNVNVRLEGLTSEPVLLPVWIMSYHYRGRNYRFLINGQSGEPTGEAPFSWKKLAAAVGIGLGLLLAILILVAVAGAM